MHLEGSCHCGAVRFSLESSQPWPYMRCYCSICRKTGGAGGHMINLGGDACSLQVQGQPSVYRALRDEGGTTAPSKHHRHFCSRCGSHLWATHEDWPELVHPVASAIDTPLPSAPSHVHIMLESKAPWVPVDVDPQDERWPGYPDKSLARWHQEHGYEEE